MRTRAKKKYVASDRARRENVPRHILFYMCPKHICFNCLQKTVIKCKKSNPLKLVQLFYTDYSFRICGVFLSIKFNIETYDSRQA